jgi:hypothetical protein
MAKKSDSSKPIKSHMGPMISSTTPGLPSKDMSKAPRKMAAGEVSNIVPRPPKR